MTARSAMSVPSSPAAGVGAAIADEAAEPFARRIGGSLLLGDLQRVGPPLRSKKCLQLQGLLDLQPGDLVAGLMSLQYADRTGGARHQSLQRGAIAAGRLNDLGLRQECLL